MNKNIGTIIETKTDSGVARQEVSELQRIEAVAGASYRIVQVTNGHTQVLDNLIAQRQGADLTLVYSHGVEIQIEGFYSEKGTSIFLPGKDDEEYELSGEVEPVAGESEITTVYAHGSSDSLNTLIESHEGLRTTLSTEMGNEIKIAAENNDFVTAQASSKIENSDTIDDGFFDDLGIWGWGLAALGIVGGGVGLGFALSNGSDNSDNSDNSSFNINGRVSAGPIISGHTLAVVAYSVDGAELGRSTINNDGTFTMKVDRNYIGLVLVRVTDSQSGNDYIDEATGVPKDLTADLRAVFTAEEGIRDYTVNINVITELVARELGLTGGDEGQAEVRLGNITIAELDTVNNSVADAFGLTTSLINGGIILTINQDGSANPEANDYGKALAGFSLFESFVSKETGTVLDELSNHKLLNAITNIRGYVTDNTQPVLTVQDYLDAGVAGVTVDIIDGFNRNLQDAAAESSISVRGLQNAVTIMVNAISKIDTYNDHGISVPIPSVQDYFDAGITGVTTGNLAAVNAQVFAATVGETDTPIEIQALVATADTAIAKIEAYNNGNGTTPTALTSQDYAEAGISGVTADNLAAMNAQVLSATVDGADTSTEIQTLVATADTAIAKIEAYNNGNGTAPAALTVEDYIKAGIRGVTVDNLDAANALILAAAPDGANSAPKIEALLTDSETAVAKIEAYNKGNGTTPAALTVEDYTAAGITGVSVDNLAAVNAQVLGAATGGANTPAEVQTLVAAANSALIKIEAYNNGNGTTPAALSAQDYANAGITGVSVDNLAAVNAQVLAAAKGDANTPVDIQTLVTAANTALTEIEALIRASEIAVAKIEAYNNGDGITPTALTVQDYMNANVSGVTADNLAAVNAQMLAAAVGETDSSPEIQVLVTTAGAALAKIEAYNNGDGNAPAALTLQDYADAGITGVNTDNLAVVNAQVLAAAAGDANTSPKVQALVTAVSSALTNIEAYNNGDGTTPVALTLQDYTDAGITGVSTDNLAAVNAQVLAAAAGDADTPTEVQTLVTAANSALTKVEAYNNGNGTTPIALTLQDYADAGITGVSADNLAAVNAQVLAAAVGDADTPTEVQTLVTAANSALTKIEAYNNGNGTTPIALTLQDYADAGITGVSADNLAAVNAQVLAAAAGDANTSPEVQTLVTAANSALTKIEAYNNGDGTTPIALTLQDYADAGITGVSADNLATVNAQVLAAAVGDADTPAEVQTLVTVANTALAKIEAYNNGNGIAPPALTVQDYIDAGIKGVTTDNLNSVNSKVLAEAAGGADTSPEIQDLVAEANSLIDLTDFRTDQGFIIQGDVGGDFAGTSVSGAGDVNGDGYADLIIGAYFGDDGGGAAGEAYIVYGAAAGAGSIDGTQRQVIDLTNFDPTEGFIIQGDTAADLAGRSVSGAGDVNGDGYADVIVGGDRGDDGGSNAGEAYIVYGSETGTGSNDGTGRQIVDLTSFTPSQGFIIQGDMAGDQVGVSVSGAGDVNGDGFADLIVGGERGDDGGTDAGEAYIVYGSAGGTGILDGVRQVIDLTSFTPAQGFIIQGDTGGLGDGDFMGISVSDAGDVNGDGYADLIVGAEGGNDGGSDAGEAYIVYGSALGTGSNDGAGRQVIDLTNFIPSQGFIIQGDTGSDFTAHSVSGAGDINGDGYGDLIVGAEGGDDGGNLAGEAYIIYGSAAGTGSNDGAGRQVIDLTNFIPSQGFIIQGDTDNDFTGHSVSGAGDLNGDGYGDLIVGAYGNDEGAAYIVYGSAAGTGSNDGAGRQVIDLTNFTPSQGFIIQGDAAGDQAGISVSGAGDVNGDGYADLIVGAFNGGDGGASAGEGYVIYGFDNEFRQVSVGTDGVDYLIGGNADDSLSGNGGVDIIRSGAGDDSISVGDLSFFDIDGGYGVDTLNIAGSGATLDLAAQNKGSTTGIEKFDLGDNSLSGLTWDAVVALASNAKVTDDALNEYDLLITGNAGQSVAGVGWIAGGSVAVNGTNHTIYTNNTHNLKVLIDNTLTHDSSLTQESIDALIKIEAYNNGDGTTPPALTNQDYLDAGVTGVTADNVAGVNAQVLAAAVGMADTALEIQVLVTAADTAIAKIEGYNNGNGTIPAALTVQDYIDAGIKGVSADNLDVVNAQVLAEATNGADTSPKIQNLVAEVNSLIDPANFLPDQGFNVQGSAGEHVGVSVSDAGDINGDGYADLIFGTEEGAEGEAYIVYGSAAALGNINLAALALPQGFIIKGDAPQDRQGWSVSGAGDVNGDGYDDLITGAPYSDNEDGNAYIIYGSSTANASNIDLSNALNNDGFIIETGVADKELGYSVSGAGDVNGDGYDDLIVGSRLGAEAYIVYGSATGDAVDIDITSVNFDLTKGFTVQGFDGQFGMSVSSAGDVNGDGYTDLIVGSIADHTAYIVYGSAAADAADIDISLASFDLTKGFTIENGGVGAGRSVSSAGDINGDGYDDVIFGASGTGEAYVVYGGTGIGDIDLNNLLPSEGFTIGTTGNTGYSVSGAGDVNGDGYDDVIVGNLSFGESGGEAYVVYGHATGTGDIDIANLTPSEGFTILAGGVFHQAGYSVSGAGDIDGDGYADLIVGAYDSNSGGNNAGEGYVIYGFDNEFRQVSVGTTGVDYLIGGNAGDSLSGNGGADIIRAGAGDDSISIGDLSFFDIDGGYGVDTLNIAGSGATLDLATQNKGSITGIEKVDLDDNSLSGLTWDAVVALASNAKVTDDDSNDHNFLITGNAGQSVGGSGWGASTGTVEVSGTNYSVYVDNSHGLSILIDDTLTHSVI